MVVGFTNHPHIVGQMNERERDPQAKLNPVMNCQLVEGLEGLAGREDTTY